MRTSRFQFTLVAVVFAIAVLGASLITDINVMDVRLGLLDRIEPHEIDEIAAAVLLLIISVVADLVTAGRRQIQLEKLAKVIDFTVRMTAGAARDCLGQLQVVRIEAEGHVPRQTLALFDRANDTLAKESSGLGHLRDLAEGVMREMGSGHPRSPGSS
jgi:hypothetical protein